MPYVEGESLRVRLQREGELPVPDAVRILRELVDALVYAHGQGLIHRDIKPDNVLLSHGHAVVTDFGIAKALSAADETGRLTGTGVSIGTPSYMAPEQAAGDPVDQRADLYSVGVLAYELLAGEPPFRGVTAQAIIAAHLGRTAAPILDQRPSVPPELAAIIARCMEKRPADRYQRAEELLSALMVVNTAPVTSTARSVPSPTPNPRPPTPRVWALPTVLGAFAVAGAVVLGAAWGLRSLLGLPDWFFPAAVVLLAAPLSFVGALTLLLLTGTALNVSSFMGLVLLVGLVVKNGIILLDFTKLRMEADDLDLETALREAARIRLRPILMTTLCTLFGLLPLALGLGTGSELQRPLALAVIGGLALSTPITLFLVPTLLVAIRGPYYRVARVELKS